jgi:hypothetical protein
MTALLASDDVAAILAELERLPLGRCEIRRCVKR